ncbi:MAG: outer membrane protein assembly factor BamB [Acinetobacter sp.]|jgi:outer membrane protein assembly factor BamB|nr:MAG: outer membrane protein assembly factor BamB [Acinetobacter sp.]
MKNIVKVPFALAILSLALVGCSSKGGIKVEQPKPNPLPKIQVTQGLQQVFSTSVSSSPKDEALHYQLDQHDGVYYSIDPDGEVIAFNGKSKLWKARPAKTLSAGVSVAEGVAIVANQKGQLFALDAKTGQLLWQQQLIASVLSPSLIQQGRVVTIANDGTVYAHDVHSGQLIWTFRIPDTSFGVRGYAAPSVIDERTVAIAASNAYVYALDIITGASRWQRRVAVNDGRGDIRRLVDIDGAPVVIGSKMISVSYQGQVTVLDVSNQKVLWSENASSLKSPAVDNQAVYVANANGHLVAYDLYNGRKLWENDELAYRTLSNPMIFGQVLVVGDYQGVLHVIDPTTGRITGREKVSGGVRTLRVEDNLLYVATSKGQFSVWQNR